MLESIDKLRDCTWIGGGKVNEYLDEIEAEVSELLKCHIPVPLDADDTPWTTEDDKFNAIGEGAIELDMIAYSVKTNRWYLLDDKRMSYAASECRHVKDHTIEDVLREFEHESYMIRVEASETLARDVDVHKAHEMNLVKYADKLRNMIESDTE